MVELLTGRTSYCKDPITVMYEPGSDFQYSDAGFCIIQLLIEDVCGKPFEAVMKELVFEPLHMNSSVLHPSISAAMSHLYSCGHNRNGDLVDGKHPVYPYAAASGLWTTPSDLALLAIEFMNSLNSTSNIGISQHSAKEMITSQGCQSWTGLGLFLDDSNLGMKASSLGWGVGFQCMLIMYPYLETGAVIMTNTDTGVHQLQGIIGEIFHSLKL